MRKEITVHFQRRRKEMFCGRPLEIPFKNQLLPKHILMPVVYNSRWWIVFWNFSKNFSLDLCKDWRTIGLDTMQTAGSWQAAAWWMQISLFENLRVDPGALPENHSILPLKWTHNVFPAFITQFSWCPHNDSKRAVGIHADDPHQRQKAVQLGGSKERWVAQAIPFEIVNFHSSFMKNDVVFGCCLWFQRLKDSKIHFTVKK